MIQLGGWMDNETMESKLDDVACKEKCSTIARELFCHILGPFCMT